MNTIKNRRAHILKICECAALVALAFGLDMLSKLVFGYLEALWPLGGSITLGMIPIVFVSYRHGGSWGIISAFVYSGIQYVTGLGNFVGLTGFGYFVSLMLDYIVAYTVIGLADIFASFFKKKLRIVGYGVGAFVVCALRFVCSFVSGAVVWYDFTKLDSWAASFSYNITYMLPTTIVTVIIIVALCAAIDPKTLKRYKKEA